MVPGTPDINISDVVLSVADLDQGKLFYAIGTDPIYLMLANGKTALWTSPSVKSASTYKRSFALRPGSLIRSKAAARCSTANYEETWPFSAERCKEQPRRFITWQKTT